MEYGKKLEEFRNKVPLVQCITNSVVTNFTANVLLSVGGSPIMSHEIEENKDMLKIVNSLLLNIGTIDEHSFLSIKEALKNANSRQIPVVFDPVGSGATQYRTKKSLELLENFSVTVIKGNLGEIASLLKNEANLMKGVDSNISDEVLQKELCIACAKKFHTTVLITGEKDMICDQHKFAILNNGVSLLQKITGTGCSLGAIIAGFLSITDVFTATITATLVMNIAAELAFKEAKTPGSFQVKLVDYLYLLSPEELQKRKRVEVYDI